MRNKNACLIVDLRTGEHLTHIPDLVTVLSAAGWKTDISLKEYGGETLQLAQQATKKKYDLVIGYGGDGTLNAILNGIMYANRKSVAADLAGGTYNVWASAIGIPEDPVQAALTLVDSEPRKIDLGHMQVEGLSSTNGQQPVQNEKTSKKPKKSTKTRQYFLQNVGIGMDALMIANISKPLKYRVGPLAFDFAALKELPRQRPFPTTVQQLDDDGNVMTSWQGDVWQVYVSKVPLFKGPVNLDPGSRADDGQLYVCLITANGPVKTLEQAFSIITHHKPDAETTQYFRGTHFSLRIPASIPMHVDGSIANLADFLHKSERSSLQQLTDEDQVTVNYRFDIKPGALQVAVPRTYDGPLFEKSTHIDSSPSPSQQTEAQKSTPPTGTQTSKKQPPADPKPAREQQKPAYKLEVIGTVSDQAKHPVFIVAGKFKKHPTNETLVLAVRVDNQTQVIDNEGKHVHPATVLSLQAGQAIIAEGKKTKRGVIQATCVRLSV